MKTVKKILIVLFVIGSVCGAIVHLLSFLPGSDSLVNYERNLLISFLVSLAVVWISIMPTYYRLYSQHGALKTWKELSRGLPSWMNWLRYGLIAYFLLQLGLLITNGNAGVLPSGILIRVFSSASVLIFFIGLVFTYWSLAVGFPANQRLQPTRLPGDRD